MTTYRTDTFNGVPRSPLIVSGHRTLTEFRQGSIHVQAGGVLVVRGTNQGSVSVESGGHLEIAAGGTVQGSLNVGRGASASIRGNQHGSLNIDGNVVVEEGGTVAGAIANGGTFTVLGRLAGTVIGSGNTIIAETAEVVAPTLRDGKSVYSL